MAKNNNSNSNPNKGNGKSSSNSGSSKNSGSYVNLGESKVQKVNETTKGVKTGGRPKK